MPAGRRHDRHDRAAPLTVGVGAQARSRFGLEGIALVSVHCSDLLKAMTHLFLRQALGPYRDVRKCLQYRGVEGRQR